MRRTILGLALLTIVVASAPACGDTAAPDRLTPRALGAEDAPVTMVEYSSLTCPHCATFHRETLPKIKETYIDTGKVRLVFSDFPLDSLAMAGSMLARCMKPERDFGFLESLFRTQATWARSPQPQVELQRLARFAGMGESEFEACIRDRDLLRSIQARAAEAGRDHDIRRTPSFVINGEKIEGARSFEEFSEVIDNALAEAG